MRDQDEVQHASRAWWTGEFRLTRQRLVVCCLRGDHATLLAQLGVHPGGNEPIDLTKAGG